VRRDGDDYIIEISQAVATGNAVAYVSQQIHPRSVFLELSQRKLTVQAIRFILLAEGEVGFEVYNVLLREWASAPADAPHPNPLLMSTAQRTDLKVPASG